jgi:PAS domain S-box-containing protein
MADLAGTITYVNPTMCRLLGEDGPQDVIGKHFSVYSREEHRRQMEE